MFDSVNDAALVDPTTILLVGTASGKFAVFHLKGQQVQAGETLAVVEAMKMENVLKAEREGTVKKINAAKGDSLALDDVILEFA